ncbi:low affinity iron permease family protein [Mesorhizobium sp. BR1-1-9]|uniref:low affinity iron permease family protein n=1 Tax=unclassified Mesorhizobium TaxID=325217 RepID=UPI001CD0FC60|nr:low affinity iron permease family protein [Mesorhizobium sp. BR1-1-9]MBZ9942257.1 low affinity iron permease family protein [Mesorhizobium sp. BR1-1-13]
MTEQTGYQLEKTFRRLAGSVARASGRPWAFALCPLSLVVWGISGPVMHYSETWQTIT